ncbi:hypothetical protein, partial [Ruminococcus champanellensis]|uniref:hypothetical protein n=1 Tax=Ruminococcus champanellensis TaxID=1161942 RepID=UPI0023F12CA1
PRSVRNCFSILFILSVFGYKNSACCQAQEGLRLWIMVTSLGIKKTPLQGRFNAVYGIRKAPLGGAYVLAITFLTNS